MSEQRPPRSGSELRLSVDEPVFPAVECIALSERTAERIPSPRAVEVSDEAAWAVSVSPLATATCELAAFRTHISVYGRGIP